MAFPFHGKLGPTSKNVLEAGLEAVELAAPHPMAASTTTSISLAQYSTLEKVCSWDWRAKTSISASLQAGITKNHPDFYLLDVSVPLCVIFGVILIYLVWEVSSKKGQICTGWNWCGSQVEQCQSRSDAHGCQIPGDEFIIHQNWVYFGLKRLIVMRKEENECIKSCLINILTYN